MSRSPRLNLRWAPLATIAIALIAAATLPAAAIAGAKTGIDVSRFQHEIDWGQVGKESDVDFAFVQASRGSGKDCTTVADQCGRDPFYTRNYNGARGEGLKTGAYHRAFPGGGNPGGAKDDAKAEAKLFVKTVSSVRRGDLLPVLDIEGAGGLDQEELRLWARVWISRIKSRLHAKPIIYTNNFTWQNGLGDTTSFAAQGHPLWIANYNVKKPSVPARNWNGNGWALWQYTSTGHVRGISGNVDKNRYRLGGFGPITR